MSLFKNIYLKLELNTAFVIRHISKAEPGDKRKFVFACFPSLTVSRSSGSQISLWKTQLLDES